MSRFEKCVKYSQKMSEKCVEYTQKMSEKCVIRFILLLYTYENEKRKI